MFTAVIAFGIVGFGVAQPGSMIQVHYALFPGQTYVLGESGMPTDEWPVHESSLARTLAASLRQDRALIRALGVNAARPEITLPDEAFMVSKYPLTGGREMEIYTSLVPEPEDMVYNVSFASNGGVW